MSEDIHKLACTGERVIEDEYQSTASSYLIYLFHIATYNFCRPYLEQKKVLEFGSGSGYGTQLMSGHCQSILGVDISSEAIDYAKKTYQSDNLEYLKIGNIESESLPFADDEFDIVISFQVMEHIRQVDKYLAEMQRVLRKEGTLIIATPNRTTRLYPGQRPWNRYHVTEYSPASFQAVVARRFPDTELFGMTGRKEVMDIELRRTRRLRIVTYLFTLPFCPEWYRQITLKLLKAMGKLVTKFAGAANEKAETSISYGFAVEDIEITKDAAQSVNIISVSTNTK